MMGSIYDYTRSWFNFCFENPEKINPNHSALYFFILSHANRLGWKEKFGLPTTMTMEAIGIKSYTTYIKTFNELVNFKFIDLIEKSKNQYSTNIIALSKFDKALDKALDKATIKHVLKQSESICESNVSIIIQDNNITNVQDNNLTNSGSDVLLNHINKTFNKEFKPFTRQERENFNQRLRESYIFEDFIKTIDNLKNDDFHKSRSYTFCTPEYISRRETIQKYHKINKLPPTKYVIQA